MWEENATSYVVPFSFIHRCPSTTCNVELAEHLIKTFQDMADSDGGFVSFPALLAQLYSIGTITFSQGIGICICNQETV